MKYLFFFIFLLVTVVTSAGCVGENQNTAVTLTPQIVYITMFVTPTQQIIASPTTSEPDCQCDLSGGCKEVSGKIEALIAIRQNCAAEMVKRSKEASGETNLSYYMSDNHERERYSSCTNHCIFELLQHYDDVCLSGFQE